MLIGLTGGIASGKSTVAGWLRDAGYLVVDADELVATLYAADGRGAEAVAEMFGESCLSEDGSVDHEAVAERVFDDPEALAALEAAIHPLVRERFSEIAAQVDDVAVLEATLLVEAGYAPDFDRVVTVEADANTRRQRAIDRGLPPEAADARLRAQGDGAERRDGADWEIHNDGGLDDLRAEVDVLVAEIEQLRSQR